MRKHKTIKLMLWENDPLQKVFADQLNKLKSVEKLHPLKSQLIFSEVSHSEWPEPFDFPSVTSGFFVYMVNTRDMSVVFLSFVLFVHHILSMLLLLLLLFFLVFFF